MRVQVDDCNEGILTKISAEDIPKNALTWAENIAIFKKLGMVQTRDGMAKAFADSFDGVLDARYVNLFDHSNIFVKAGTVLYRGIRPIKQNLSSNRMDSTEFANWLILCDGVNTLKYKNNATLSWLVACSFDFEEANIPSGWTVHQSCIPFRVSHDTHNACTQDWERASIDNDTSVSSSGFFYTSAVDLSMGISTSPPNADLLLHLNSNFSDTMSNHTVTAHGDASIDTDKRKFGAGSATFDGNGDYLTIPYSTSWYLYDEAFTVDCQFAIRSGSSAYEHCIFSWVASVSGYVLWYNSVSSTFHFFVTSLQNPTQGATFTMSFQKALTEGQFYHIAVIRGWNNNANTWAITIDGVVMVTETESLNIQMYNKELNIGRVDAAIDGTLRDYSVLPHTVTATDVTAVSTYKKWGDLCYRNNTAAASAALSIPQDSSVTIQSDFTLDCWLRLEQLGTVQLLSSKDDFDSPTEVEDISLWLSISTIGLYISASAGGSALYSKHDFGSHSDLTSSWFHLAVVRVGSDWGLYVNGVQVSYISESNTTTVDASAGSRILWRDSSNSRQMYMDEFRFHSGNPFSAAPNNGKSDTITTPVKRHDSDDETLLLLRPTNMYLDGYIDEFRWLKGEARWNSNFDAPTSEDSGTGTTVTAADSSAGDMAVPLGMDAPSTAPNVATGVAGALTGTYRYKVTYVNADSFESNPSDASAQVTPSSEKVNLTALPQSNNPQVVARNIYRTEAGGSVYYYLTQVDNNYADTYTDNAADSTLGNRVETNHDEPPALQAIHSHGSRLFGITATYPNKLVWCNAWDEWEYFDTNNFEPFGSESEDTKRLFTLLRVLVLIQGAKVWRFDTTKFPEYYWVKDQAGTIRGIQSPAAAVDIGHVIFCADADGGFLLSQAQTKSVTDRIAPLFDGSSSTGESIDPNYYDSIAVGYLKEFVYISYTSKESTNQLNDKTVVLNLAAERIEQIIDKGFYSFTTDETNKVLYGACVDGYIYQFFSSADSERDTLDWEFWTKDFNGDIGPEMLLKEANFFWIDCNPNGGTITVNVYLDGETKLGHSISGSSRKVESFRLPNQQFYRIQFKISGSGEQYVYRWAFDAQPMRGQYEIPG